LFVLVYGLVESIGSSANDRFLMVAQVDKIELLMAYRCPQNSSMTAVESAAKPAMPTQPYWLHAILFGKWRG
jgi:hypothetical protein